MLKIYVRPKKKKCDQNLKIGSVPQLSFPIFFLKFLNGENFQNT